ncbi:hypothetical protein D3C78_892090 [compost metagenome]
MDISTRAPLNGSFVSGQAGTIDKQIQMLMKRKMALIRKISEVVTGQDDPKVKVEKTKVIRMEINFIDLQIQQLIQKKAEMENGRKSSVGFVADKLPPSPSDLIHPDREQQEGHFINIQV